MSAKNAHTSAGAAAYECHIDKLSQQISQNQHLQLSDVFADDGG